MLDVCGMICIHVLGDISFSTLHFKKEWTWNSTETGHGWKHVIIKTTLLLNTGRKKFRHEKIQKQGKDEKVRRLPYY